MLGKQAPECGGPLGTRFRAQRIRALHTQVAPGALKGLCVGSRNYVARPWSLCCSSVTQTASTVPAKK